MRAMTSGVFFQRRAATAGLPDPVDVDVVGQQRAPSPRDGAALEAQQRRDARVAAAPGLQRFEPGIQAPLLLVEDAEKQHNRCPELLRHEGRFGQRPGHAGLGKQGSAPHQLLTPPACVRRAVQEPARNVFTSHTSGAHERAHRVLGADVEAGVEFFHKIPELSGLDHGDGRRQQCAGAGEPDLLVHPQTQFVELHHVVEGVVAATVGVACPGRELLQLAEHGAPGVGAQRRHQLRQRGDLLLAQERGDGCSRKLRRSHYGTITLVIGVMVP